MPVAFSNPNWIFFMKLVRRERGPQPQSRVAVALHRIPFTCDCKRSEDFLLSDTQLHISVRDIRKTINSLKQPLEG